MCENVSNEKETVELGDCDAMHSIPMQSSSLRKNDFVLIKDRPCKIVQISTPNKIDMQENVKVHLTGIDSFDGKKYEFVCPSLHQMNLPNVTRKDFSVSIGCNLAVG